MSEKTSFSVASIMPFWRWAVCPESNCSPGIPFYSKKAAREFFESTKKQLPWAGLHLIHRSWTNLLPFGGVDVIEYYPGTDLRDFVNESTV